jgi:hypothetical protein
MAEVRRLRPFDCAAIRQALIPADDPGVRQKRVSGVFHCIKIGYVAILEAGERLLVFFNLGSAVACFGHGNITRASLIGGDGSECWE